MIALLIFILILFILGKLVGFALSMIFLPVVLLFLLIFGIVKLSLPLILIVAAAFFLFKILGKKK